MRTTKYTLAIVLSTVWLLIINLSCTNDSSCTYSKISIMNYELVFPITIEEASNKYNLRYYDHQARSDTTKNTIIVAHTNWAYTEKNSDVTKTIKRPQYKVYAYFLHIKNPSKVLFDSIKANLETQFSAKFVRKKFEKFENIELAKDFYYYYAKPNNCIQIVIQPSTPFENAYYVIGERKYDPKFAHSCTICIFYKFPRTYLESTVLNNGIFDVD